MGLPHDCLVGVSGGLDSVALLHALVRADRSPVVLHFDHGWRAESRIEAEAVRKTALGLGLRCVIGRARASTPATESAARAARYAFFASAARKLQRPDLVLAHHADDQVETFLLQLLRGGGSGAHGMATLARRDGLVLHRPWLGLWRREIAAYARANHLVWHEDPTNARLIHRRNRVRARLLPYLQKQFGPAVAENLRRAAEIAREEGEWLTELCAPGAEGRTLEVTPLRSAPVAQQRRTIRLWLLGQRVGDLTFAEIEAVRGLLHRIAPARVNLSRGRHACRRAGRIFLA